VLCLFPAVASFGNGGATEQIAAAKAALSRGDGIAAEVALRRALDRGAGQADVAARMGEAELLQGDMAQARRSLGPGQFAAGEQAHGFRMLGRLEIEDGNLAAAGQAFDRALQVAPNNADLWVDIGRLRYRGGEQVEAIAAVEKAVALDPRNVGALTFQGQLVRDAIGPVAALNWFVRAKKVAPDDPDILGEYAATLGELGRAKEMLAVTRRMIELDPRNPHAFYLQAVLAARGGQDALARRLLQRTGDAFRDMPSAMLLGGILEFRAGNLATSIDLFDRLWQRQPDNRSVALLLARALYQSGAMRELADRFGPLADQADASPYLLRLVGRAHEALNERQQAAVYLDRAAAPRRAPHLVPLAGDAPVGVLEPRWRADPYSPDNVIPLVRQLLATGGAVRAVAIAEQTVARFPGSADARMLAGDARMASGDYAAALEHYRLSARVRLSRPLLARIAAAHSLSGQAARAEVLVDGYLAQHPMDGRTAGWAADFALHRGEETRAAALLDQALQQPGGRQDPDLLAQRAMAALRTGDEATARKDALAAYRLQRGSGAITLVLAKVLAASEGDKNAVVQALKAKALRLGAGT
jgi:tetratricopeptide (TPR) repeat protein